VKVLKWCDEHLEEIVLSFLLGLISCVMMLQIIMRYVFNSSLSWAEELSRYAFIWSTFLSIGFTIRKKTILKVDTFVEVLPHLLKNIIKIFAEITVIAFFIYLFFNSIPVVGKIYLSNQTSPAMNIPMYLIYSSAVVGFFLTIIRSIQNLAVVLKDVRGK